MKNNFFFFILFPLTLHCSVDRLDNVHHENHPSAITWEPNGGRFGDNLLSYSKVKWLSYKFNIPILYLPFKYSDCLMLHEQEIMYTHESEQLFSTMVHLPTGSRLQLLPYNNTLYISHWKTEITIDWNDKIFVEELRKNIAPRSPIEKIAIPDNCISIAVHVRHGGGFVGDTEQERERCPLRFASDEFFIDQIARLADMFKEENLYVYIFTDHQNPTKLKKKFQKALQNPRITFDCRINDNGHNANVLEDFFSMMDFDCLIRPGSHFSRFVQRLGNNKVVIYPESVRKTIGGK